MKPASGSGIFETDDWSLCEGVASGHPIIVRMRSTLPSAADQQLFARLLILTWAYAGNESGMPDRADLQHMQAFEDALESGTENRLVAYQALSLTGNGNKEWRYYAKDQDAFLASLNADLTGHPAYPLEIQSFYDPDWSALREYLSAV